MSIEGQMERAVAAHFTMPKDIARLARLATWDLYFGPIDEADDGGEWPGFCEACEKISAWCDENLEEVWYDTQSGEVLDRKPQGCWLSEINPGAAENEEEDEWVEPYWEDYYHLEVKDVKRALFDRELVAHI